jgi:opacity protein-like surface antigen
MFKKTVALGAIVTTVCATSTLAHSGLYRSGFLAGAQVGASFGDGKFNSTLNVNPALVVNKDSQTGSARKTSALFGLLGGYRHIYHQDFTLGFLVELNLLTNNELNKRLVHTGLGNAPFTNKVKKTFTVIPTVTVGKIFCGRWHASLGLGLAIARFKHQADFGGTNAASASGSVTKVGFAPSLGIEYATTNNVSLFGNVAYEMYGRSTKTLNFPTFLIGGVPSTYRTSVKPSYFTFKLGAMYRF